MSGYSSQYRVLTIAFSAADMQHDVQRNYQRKVRQPYD